MIDTDRAIKVLEQSGLADCEAEAKEVCEALEYAIDNLKMKQWMITEYEQMVDMLEQDIADMGKETMGKFILSTRLAVYNRVLKDLKGDGEE